MITLKVHREIMGKDRCDLCGGKGPVFEISVPSGAGKGHSLWFDACNACIKRHKSGRGIIGPLGFVRGLYASFRGTGNAN